MKRILFIILVISLLITACSNSGHNNVIETPKAEDSAQPDSSDTASPTSKIDIPNENNNSVNDEFEGIIDEPDQALGDCGDTFDRLFVESTNDTAFTDLIVGREELSKFINEEIEPHKFEKQSLPLVYKIIQHFNIPKETAEFNPVNFSRN